LLAGFRILFPVGVSGYDTDVDDLESFELYSAAMLDEIAHARSYPQVLRHGIIIAYTPIIAIIIVESA
jgi:hypothetical protein